MATKELTDLFVCVDCGYCLANGPMDEPSPGWDVNTYLKDWDGYVVVNGDSDNDHDFSWSPCDCCRNPLGGARMHCVAWEA